MNRKLLFLLLIALFTGACKKEDDKTNDQATIDDGIINEYLNAHDLSATKHESGMYYIIHKTGSGENPDLSNTVRVDYKGYFTDGTVFDETAGEPAEFELGYVITGFQIGVIMLKPGGSATLFIPSALGYGNTPRENIPANSVLIFDVELVEFF